MKPGDFVRRTMPPGMWSIPDLDVGDIGRAIDDVSDLACLVYWYKLGCERVSDLNRMELVSDEEDIAIVVLGAMNAEKR